MWKAPTRPQNNQITQVFEDGIVTIYAVRNTAKPGYMPAEGLTEKARLRYEEQRLGIQRYYEGRQNQSQIERVIRTPRAGNVSNQDIAVTEDGAQYGIDLVQNVTGIYPPCVDITLAKIEQVYEVPQNEMV